MEKKKITKQHAGESGRQEAASAPRREMAEDYTREAHDRSFANNSE
jgi:hypothetical protein